MAKLTTQQKIEGGSSLMGGFIELIGISMQADAAKDAASFNAAEAERNAQLVREQAIEDEKQFRMAFRREQASNRARLGASGVKASGSPLAALQDNAARAEADAIAIRKRGNQRRISFLREAGRFRVQKKAIGAQSRLAMAGSVLKTGSKAAGAFS